MTNRMKYYVNRMRNMLHSQCSGSVPHTRISSGCRCTYQIHITLYNLLWPVHVILCTCMCTVILYLKKLKIKRSGWYLNFMIRYHVYYPDTLCTCTTRRTTCTLVHLKLLNTTSRALPFNTSLSSRFNTTWTNKPCQTDTESGKSTHWVLEINIKTITASTHLY